jgi:hypothetical protein
MDILATLRSKIEALPEGEYSGGLRAVLLHIETALNHLSRGQKQDDETAFTDAIYRTNQAFEGSIKEAYRVLAGQDPAKKRPYDIENYLEDNNAFRPRVLAQFTNYRTEWRNPSTHDYKLDFDESEAFLAIVSVSAFACLLIDQISGKLAFLHSKKETDSRKKEIATHVGTEKGVLLELITEMLKEFARQRGQDSPIRTETELEGALAGFFSSLVPSLRIDCDYKLDPQRSERADFVVSDKRDKVIIELRRSRSRMPVSDGIKQLEHYMLLSGIRQAILFVHPASGGELVSEEHVIPGISARVIVIRPAPTGAAPQISF